MSHDGDGGRLVLQRSPRVVRGQTEAPDVLYAPGSCQGQRDGPFLTPDAGEPAQTGVTRNAASDSWSPAGDHERLAFPVRDPQGQEKEAETPWIRL